MKKILCFGLLLFSLGIWAQPNPCIALDTFRIVVLGSSTAAGTGSSQPDSAWVNRFRKSILAVNPANQLINLAVGGYHTYRLMPSSYLPPASRPMPDTTRNITAALSLRPDAIIVNLPSNDVALGYSYAEQMANFDTIRAQAQTAGIPIWICTTQPRNFSLVQRQLQAAIKDSILSLYAPRVINFWDGIALADFSIDPFFDSGDGVHLNDAGHALLHQRAVDLQLLPQLYQPAATIDIAAINIQAQGTLVCGDSLSVFDLLTTNLGPNDSLPVQCVFELTAQSSGITYVDTLTQTTGIATCRVDTFRFVANTYAADTYEVVCVLHSNGDTVVQNDRLMLSFSTLGHPSILAVDDTLCGAGTATLSVLYDAQDTVLWYDNLSSLMPLAYGASYTTPPLINTSIRYAQAVRGPLYYTNTMYTTAQSNINWNGTMFDIRAINDLVVDSFALKINTVGLQEVEIYTKVGSHLGAEQNQAAWTFKGSVFVQVASFSELTTVPLGGFSIAANDTLGVYIQLANASSRLSYLNTGTAQTYSNTTIEVISGSGSNHNCGGSFYPRLWNGGVFYHHGTRLEGDCATNRTAVNALVSNFSFSLGQDTIIDLQDTLLIVAPNGMIDYQWFDGDSAAVYSLVAASIGTGIHFISVLVTDSLQCSYSDSVIIGIANLLSSPIVSNQGTICYPNPTSGLLFFRGILPSTADLLSLDGKLIGRYALKGRSLDISALANGFYWLRLEGHLVGYKVFKYSGM